MSLSSLTATWNKDGARQKPRMRILEILDPNQPEGKPAGWLMLEREETVKKFDDGTVFEASISISYEMILPKFSHHTKGKGSFVGGYRKFLDSEFVSLTSTSPGRGAVFLDLPGLKGHRIGTYLMNEIVSWVKQWPVAEVFPIELLSTQAYPENKERRNWFYEQFGIKFDYTDPERREEGRSLPMLAKDLKNVDTWTNNIREMPVLEYFAEILYKEEHASLELEFRENAIERLVKERRDAQARPIRWAIRMLWWKYGGILTNAAIVSVLAAAAWFRLR